MDDAHIKRRHRELSARQQAYVQNRAKGHTKQESAIMAGYADDDKTARQVEESPAVQQELAKARAETADAIGITKKDVAQMLLDAAQMAKVMADPQALVRAASELGKMLGHYAPEVKKVEHGVDIDSVKKAVAQLSEEELIKLARGRIVEGEVLHVQTSREPAQLPKGRDGDEEV